MKKKKIPRDRDALAWLAAYAEPVRVRISKDTEGAGREGWMLAKVFAGQIWAVVLFDGDEDPVTFKAACLEVRTPVWSKC